MAGSFNPRETRRLLDAHRELIAQLYSLCYAADGCRARVKDASDALATRELYRTLDAIPVEELNRDKRGIRTKTLRDSGYETLADVARASVYALTAVNGISEGGAIAVKQLVNEIAAKAGRGVRVRLSTDDRTPEATALVSALSRYTRARAIAAETVRLLDEYKPRIEACCGELEAVAGGLGLKWLFTPSDKKKRAAASFDNLNALMNGFYGRQASAQLSAMDAVMGDRSDPWQAFERDPVGFYNALEDVTPGVLGNDDDVYGLPEELAKEIAVEPILTDGLKCELRRYQEWGVRYVLHQKRVLLGDEMGLGKTVQAIAVMVSLRNGGESHFAVVCPASVITNWCREIEKMSDLPVVKVHGQGRKAALAAWQERGGVMVTTYETTAHCTLEDDFRYALLVVDEAHYIKNPEARRTIHVRELATHADSLLFMTGTALENRVDEMITLIRALRPNVAVKLQGMAALSSAPQFRDTAAPVYYRRRREDVLTELPELIESREWCDLSKTEEEAYEKAVLSGNYAAIRRVSWHVDDLKDSSKAKRLLELVEEAESDGRKVIVFSFFLDTIAKVRELLGERCTDPINGSVPPPRRQEIIDEFDKAPAGTVLVAQIQSGGTGLNIQSASVVILCEPQFKPSVENQAISRAYRMGQTRNVLVYRLLCDNTVDEKLIKLLEDKQTIFDAFADTSSVADESREIDEKTFGAIVQEEAERIAAKRALPAPDPAEE